MKINGYKVGRNEPCLCGSGVKFKKCCLKTAVTESDVLNNIEDNFNNIEIEKANKAHKEISKMGKFKHCLYGHKEDCEGRIVRAHTIQNNGVIKDISDNGKVYMPKTDSNNNFPGLYGRKEATVFTGFCEKHDKELFRVIEDEEFIGTLEQIYMLTYRTVASELYTMIETSESKKEFVITGKHDEIFKIPDSKMIDKEILKNNYEVHKQTMMWDSYVKYLGSLDLLNTKKKMDEQIVAGEFKGVMYVYRKYEEEIKFSGSVFAGLEYDLDGNKIQSLGDKNVESMMYNVVYKDLKTHVVISWLSEGKSKLDGLGEQINKLNDVDFKKYVSNIMLMYGEKIVINPKSYDVLTEDMKSRFYDICFMHHNDITRYLTYKTSISDLGFNLFELK